jgi:hypothetical protein
MPRQPHQRGKNTVRKNTDHEESCCHSPTNGGSIANRSHSSLGQYYAECAQNSALPKRSPLPHTNLRASITLECVTHVSNRSTKVLESNECTWLNRPVVSHAAATGAAWLPVARFSPHMMPDHT